MITTSNPKYGNINMLIELGSEIHVNYYFKYSVTDPSIVVDLNKSEWIEWLSLLAYAVGRQNVIIHSNYTLKNNISDTIEQRQMKTRYTFSENIYLYMKNKTKFFVFDEIITGFDYGQLDYLEKLPITEYIKPTDKNELYRIAMSSNKQNLAELYLYIVEEYPKLIKIFEEKMDSIYDINRNPFRNIIYTLNAWRYLYDRYLINKMPSDKDFSFKKTAFKKFVGDKKIKKFKNRLRTFLLNK
nr:ADP ribosyltransferase exoenzyme domain [Mimivirus sp.]